MPERATSLQPMRLTPQRRAVLEAVRVSDDHPSARDLHERVRRRLPTTGMATVYRALDLLVAGGQVLELQFSDDPASRYDGNVTPHDHVRCRSCGAVADITVEISRRALAAAAGASGFSVDGYTLELQGRCAACSQD